MLIAGNFKSFKTRKETANYLKRLDKLVINSSQEIIIFPPATTFDNFSLKKVKIGSQNGYPAKNGAFTGEITLEQLEEFNIKNILIGHSERRNILKEDNNLIKEKFNFYKSQDFNIILCIGESLELRKKGFESVKEFLLSQLKNIDVSYQNLIIAYEPIWAIGTGITPTNGEIKETIQFIKGLVKKPTLYGGSVKESNIKEILKNSDGVLVGGASLSVDTFANMVKIADLI
jgi:triosephosphate isomerase